MTSTTTFSITRDDAVKAVLRQLRVIGAGDSPITEDYTDISFALNLTLKELPVDGYFLWKITDVPVPMVAGQVTYTIGPGGDVDVNRPLRIHHAFVRNSAGSDFGLQLLARQDYDTQSQKTTPGQPTGVYYDPQLAAGSLSVYPVPVDSSDVIHLVVQQQLNDISSSDGTDTFDLSQEWYKPLIYITASYVAPEYETDATLIARIDSLAMFYRTKIADWSVTEDVPTTFVIGKR